MKDLKDFGTTCALIGGVMWLLGQIEDGPKSVDIPIYSTQILALPVFAIGAWMVLANKHSVIGLLLMGGVAYYLFGGVA